MKVEEPEIVTVDLVAPDGATISVKFTREEYTAIEVHALVRGVSVERYLLDCALEYDSAHPSTMAAKRGLS